MEEKGLQDDPRYGQLLGLRARAGGMMQDPSLYQSQSPHPNGNLQNESMKVAAISSTQMQQLKAQIMAYRFLARNHPLPPHIAAATNTKRQDSPTDQGPNSQLQFQGQLANRAPPQGLPVSSNNKFLTSNGFLK